MYQHCPHPESELTLVPKTDQSSLASYLCKACGSEIPSPAYQTWKELGLRMFHGCQN